MKIVTNYRFNTTLIMIQAKTSIKIVIKHEKIEYFKGKLYNNYDKEEKTDKNSPKTYNKYSIDIHLNSIVI